jgi:hypothetical protein
LRIFDGRGDPGETNSLVLGKGVVGVAIKPAFSWLSRDNDWMTSRVRVFAGVTIRRAVAAKGHAAFLAGSQMDPIAADFHTFLALEAAWAFDRFDRFDMGTFAGDHLMSVRPETSYAVSRAE